MVPQSNDTYRTLADLAAKKQDLKDQISLQQQVVNNQYEELLYLFSPENIRHAIAKGFSMGFSMLDSFAIGMKVFRIVRNLFRRK